MLKAAPGEKHGEVPGGRMATGVTKHAVASEAGHSLTPSTIP